MQRWRRSGRRSRLRRRSWRGGSPRSPTTSWARTSSPSTCASSSATRTSWSCTARNERLAKAIHDEVHLRLKREGLLPARAEGVQEARWVLLDYLDCVLHVFVPETRELYRLEQLWGEAPAARGC